MIQRLLQLSLPCFVFVLLGVWSGGCDRASAPPAKGGIVSLSPAATDLLLAMGAGSELVGVSTFDSDPRVASLPRIGDYETVDWERIQTLAPKTMIVQISADRMPAGFVDRAQALGITLHSAKIDRFTDIIVESELIGEMIGRAEASRKMWQELRDGIDEVKTRVAQSPRVRTLIVTTEDGLGVAGTETFLDDVVGFAGGVNALGAQRPGYTKIDRELLLAIQPDAIVQLMPAATQAQRDAAANVWKSLPELPAVKHGRIYTFTQDWVLMPNSHVAELAEQIAAKLHPEAK